MIDLHVYVLHCAENCAARKQMCGRLEELLKSGGSSHGFRAHFCYVTDFDPQQLIDMGSNMATLVDFNADAIKDQPDLAPEVRTMHVNQLSCALKHAAALSRVASSAASKGGYHVVLEDDCLFTDGLCEQLQRALQRVPTDYDIVFLGLPTPNAIADDLKAPDAPAVVFDELAKTFPTLPSCEAYLVNPYAAMRMASAFAPIRLPANLQLTLALRRGSLKAYLAAPNLFVDGSKLGVYVSQQEPNNRLAWNEQFVKLEALVNGPLPSTPEALQAAQEFVDKLQFRTHPDILRLLGRLQVRLQNYKEAEVIFSQVFSILSGEKCVMNQQSQFLRDYMSLHKHLQADIKAAAA